MSSELCPFCSKPITREYGSFRCKSCARSSEDLIDQERKVRAAEVRRAARAAKAETRKLAEVKAQKQKLLTLALARHAERKLSGALQGGGSAAPRARKKATRSA